MAHLASNGPSVLVLASGRGERFAASGGSGSKLRAMLGGMPVLEHTIAAVRESGLPFHVEDRGHPGMGDSIAAAVRVTRDAAGWLVLPGDLPLIQPRTLMAIAAALATAPAGDAIVLPSYRGQRGHPVGFGPAFRDALLALSGAQGAQSILRAQAAVREPVRLELDDAGIVTDVDTVQDLLNAERLISVGRGRPGG